MRGALRGLGSRRWGPPLTRVYDQAQSDEFYRSVNTRYVHCSGDLFRNNLKRTALCFREIQNCPAKTFRFRCGPA